MSANESIFSDLMVKSQGGDKTAYVDLLHGLHGFLKNYLKRRIFNSDDQEDVIQEVLMAVHKSKQTYDADKPFMKWFLSITEYKITDYIRLSCKKNINNNVEYMKEELGYLNSDDLKWDLQKAITQLTPKESEILELLKIEGLKVSEVAVKMDLSESNVKVLMHRTHQKLQLLLGTDYENK